MNAPDRKFAISRGLRVLFGVACTLFSHSRLRETWDSGGRVLGSCHLVHESSPVESCRSKPRQGWGGAMGGGCSKRFLGAFFGLLAWSRFCAFLRRKKRDWDDTADARLCLAALPGGRQNACSESLSESGTFVETRGPASRSFRFCPWLSSFRESRGIRHPAVGVGGVPHTGNGESCGPFMPPQRRL